MPTREKRRDIAKIVALQELGWVIPGHFRADEPDAASGSIEVLRQKMDPDINNTPDPTMV